MSPLCAELGSQHCHPRMLPRCLMSIQRQIMQPHRVRISRGQTPTLVWAAASPAAAVPMRPGMPSSRLSTAPARPGMPQPPYRDDSIPRLPDARAAEQEHVTMGGCQLLGHAACRSCLRTPARTCRCGREFSVVLVRVHRTPGGSQWLARMSTRALLTFVRRPATAVYRLLGLVSSRAASCHQKGAKSLSCCFLPHCSMAAAMSQPARSGHETQDERRCPRVRQNQFRCR